MSTAYNSSLTHTSALELSVHSVRLCVLDGWLLCGSSPRQRQTATSQLQYAAAGGEGPSASVPLPARIELSWELGTRPQIYFSTALDSLFPNIFCS